LQERLDHFGATALLFKSNKLGTGAMFVGLVSLGRFSLPENKAVNFHV
jgi:hypothetical protein